MSIFSTIIRLITGICFSFLVSASALAAEPDRYALVIGNSQYALSPLKNPVNDATDMSRQLKTLGYRIHRNKPLLDLDRASFEQAILDFAVAVPAGSTSIVYFAGHGVAVDGENYLLPVGDHITTVAQLKDRAISLTYAVTELEDHNPDGLNVFLLDACRNNPLGRSFTRSLPSGLLKLGGAEGSFVGYAAGAGQVAIDGGYERNGVYTEELLYSLANESHLTIEEMHKRIKTRVQKKTGEAQSPMYEANFTGTYCFGVCNNSIGQVPPAPDSSTSIPPPDPITNTSSPEPAPSVVRSGKKSWLYIALGVLAVGAALSLSGGDDPPPTVNTTLNIPLPD